MSWKTKWGKNAICPISQTRLRPGCNKDGFTHVIKIKCGHRFYRKALYKWYDTKPYCPICRANIKF